MKTIYLLSMTTMILVGCGVEDAVRDATAADPAELSDFQGDSQSPEFSEYVNDLELVSASAHEVADEATSSLTDAQAGETVASLYLAEPESGEKAKRVQRDRICDDSGDSVIIDIERGMEKKHERVGPRRSLERHFKFSSVIKREWSNDNNDLVCDDGKKHISFKDIDFATNVKLVATFEREKSQSMKFTNLKFDRAVDAFRAFKSSGERQVSWISVEQNDDENYVAKRSVTIDAKRMYEVKRKNGELAGFETSLVTKEDAPLVQIIERQKDSRKAISRTIESGTMVATRKDGSRLEKSFFDVVYKLENKCLPVSGKIEGSIFKKDEDEASRKYTIEFGEDSAEITFDNGEKTEFVPEGCELEDNELNDEAEVESPEESNDEEEETEPAE